jgi:WD40 repeat protein
MNGKREKTLHGEHSNRVLYSALSPSGKYLASGAGDKKLLLWKLFPEDEKKGELLGNFDLR